MTRKRIALAAVLLVGLSYATIIQSFSWNQTSHYDLIRALNQEKTTITPYQSNTGDKVEYPKGSGQIYSARAPGLALFSLPFYDVLNLVNAESWTARSASCRRASAPATRACANFDCAMLASSCACVPSSCARAAS